MIGAMSDFRDVIGRLGAKVEARSTDGPDTLAYLLRQARRAWSSFFALSHKKYGMALEGLDVSDINRVLMERDNELAVLDAHIKRVTARLDRGA